LLTTTSNALKLLIRQFIRHAKAGNNILINRQLKACFSCQSNDFVDTLGSTQSLLKGGI